MRYEPDEQSATLSSTLTPSCTPALSWEELAGGRAAEDVIAQYILEVRGRGSFLGYDEYGIVREWVTASSRGPEDLLIILSGILPAYFEKRSRPAPDGRAGAGAVPSIKGLRSRVLKILASRQ